MKVKMGMVRLGIRIRNHQGRCRRWGRGYRGRQVQWRSAADWAAAPGLELEQQQQVLEQQVLGLKQQLQKQE
jgi:hypothetical protein